MGLLVRARKPSHRVYSDPQACRIQQLRYCLLVHSLLYYELSITLITDKTWDEWAKELVQLQSNYPDSASKVIFHEAFKDFDASTGYYLPYKDFQILNICRRLLRDNKNAISQLESIQFEGYEYENYKEKLNGK